MNITVLIANKNYGNYISEAIESCFDQTLKPTCICIVDDCSDDNSWDVIKSYTNEELRESIIVPTDLGNMLLEVGSRGSIDIVGIRLPQSVGPAQARNVGINITIDSTDIYAILDADDKMLPKKLELCSKPLEQKTIGVVYANYYNKNIETGASLIEVKEPYDTGILYKRCIVHSGSLIKTDWLKQVVDENGFYDKNLRTAEDYELWIRLSKICLFYHIPEILTEVKVHSQNSTNTTTEKERAANLEYIYKKHTR